MLTAPKISSTCNFTEVVWSERYDIGCEKKQILKEWYHQAVLNFPGSGWLQK